jgi:tRNA pseudouridine13 synthase
MKIKQAPDDFMVEELTDVVATTGPFALYRMVKRGWGTPEALAAIRRRWNIDLHRLSYGGLKDRHAHTIQYFSILNGPKRRLTHHDIEIDYLGQIPQAYRSTDIRANRFRITLRDLAPNVRANFTATATALPTTGVPNYFDDQRFGSVSKHGPLAFAAREWVFGRFEAGLQLALTAPYEYDPAEQKHEKATLRRLWGDWPALKQQLGRSHARSIVEYLLHHPTDFRGAVARLRPDLQGLYLSAYQSHLWNQTLAHWLNATVPAERLTPLQLRLGAVPAPANATPDELVGWRELQLPLPSARLTFDATAWWASALQAVLSAEGLPLADMKIKGLREPFFSKGDRPAFVVPAEWSFVLRPDSAHAGRLAAELRFSLPRGAYATMIVKRLTQG